MADSKQQGTDSAPAAKRAAPAYVDFRGLSRIDYNTPLPEYDHGPVKAYRAQSTSPDSGAEVAYICERHLVPRMRLAANYKAIANPVLTPLVSHGVAFWPPANQERYIFIYKNAFGNRIIKDDRHAALGWRQDDVMNMIVRPMITLLQDCRDKEFVLGNIRPSNFFDGGKGVKPDCLVLGDCLATPAFSMQPAVYEPVYRGTVHPLARGYGAQADDIYALGVTIATFLRAHDPLKDMSDEEIIQTKLMDGSYAAVTGKDRFKGSILELLRGMLHDDARQRWTLEEMLTWLDGQRMSPKQSVKYRKAARPLEFRGKKYNYAVLLALDLEKSPEDTQKIVDNEDLKQWLERSLDDDEIALRVETAVQTTRERGSGIGFHDRLVSALSIALDPQAPIRYRGLHLVADGIGKALAESVALKKDVQIFSEIFSNGVIMNWLNTRESGFPELGSLISRMDNCRAFISAPKPGYGIERCLYLLCPEAQCMSEKVRDYFVTSSEELLKAFEDICQKGLGPPQFLDRHITAFLAARDAKSIEPHLYEIGSNDEAKRLMGTLKTLAAIQKRMGSMVFPGIAKTVYDRLPVVYNRFHDRRTREKLQVALKKYAEQGDLVRMAAALDNPSVINADMQGFRIAMTEYVELAKEYNRLEAGLAEKHKFGRSTGREFSAVVSSIIAAIIIVFMAIMFVTSKSLF